MMYTVVLFIVLGLIIFQDLKFRRIHFLLPIALFLVSGVKAYVAFNLSVNNILIIAILLAVILCVVSIVFTIKTGKFINPFKAHMGIGDILFFLAITPLFNVRPYILCWILGMFFSLVLFKALRKQSDLHQTIPLAGYFSIWLIICVLANTFTSLDYFRIAFI